MRYEACDLCRRFYVIPPELPPQSPCRHCQRPLRRATSTEALVHVKAEFRARWAREAVDEAKSLREQMAVRTAEARELRQRLAQTTEDVQAAVERPTLTSVLLPSEDGWAQATELLPAPETETIVQAVTSAGDLADDYLALLSDLREVEAVAEAGSASANELLRICRSERDNCTNSCEVSLEERGAT